MSTKESTVISCCLTGFLNPSPFLACAQLGDESHLPDTSCANIFLPSTALTPCSLCSSAARDKRLINKQIHQPWSLGSFVTCAYCALCFPPFNFEINQHLLHADHPLNQDRQSLPVLNIWKPPYNILNVGLVNLVMIGSLHFTTTQQKQGLLALFRQHHQRWQVLGHRSFWTHGVRQCLTAAVNPLWYESVFPLAISIRISLQTTKKR